jgi:hypothetical protein
MGCRWGPLSCPRLLLLLLLPQIPLCSNLVVAFWSSSVMRAQHVGQEAAWEPSFSECARIHSVLLREPTPCACYLFIILFYYIIINLFGVGWEGGGGVSDVAICNVFWVWGDLVDRMVSYSVLDHVDCFLLDVRGFRHVMLDNSYSQALCNLKQSEPHSLYPCFPDLQSARRIRFERERGVALGGGHLGRV